jgi:hypothetical protein
MPGTKVGPKDAAQEFLIANARKCLLDNKVIPTMYTRLDPQQIYDYLLVNWADHKGNAAMAYGSVGEVSTIIGAFDFGIFICPGVANLSLNLAGQISRTDETILLIHYAMPGQMISIANRLSILKRVENTVNKPVTFMAMKGVKTGGSLTLTAAASIGSGTSLLGIGDALSLGAFGFTLGGASISGSFSGNFYTYYDNRPGFYENGKNQYLLDDFTASLGTRHTHYLKREAVAWLREVKKKYVTPKTGVRYDKLKKQFKSLPSFNFPGFRASTEQVNARLSEILDALDVLPGEEKIEIHNSIVRYKNDLKRAVSAQKEYLLVDKKGRERGRNVVDQLCFLNLKNKKGEAKLKISVLNSPVDGAMGGSTGLGTNVADGSDTLKAASTFTVPSITLGAGTEITTKYVRTFYRYQTFAFGSKIPNRIVYTQDVIASYFENNISVAMQMGLDTLVGRDVDLSGVHIFDKSLEGVEKVKAALLKGKGKTWGKRSLKYKAVAAYWNHSNSKTFTEVSTLNGSGLSFGCSMRIQDLLRLSLEENQAGDETLKNKKVQHYAALLRASNDQFREFAKYLLVGSELKTGQDAITGFENLEKYGAVLVESSFRFTKSVTLNMAKNGSKISQTQPEDLTEKAAWKEFFNGNSTDAAGAGLELEAIRVRLRLGDHTSNSRSVFRLGLYLFGSGVGFDLSKVEAAGNEGILEIHTHNFIPFDQDLKRVSENLRDGVPPVMLMPHHFNE